MLYATADCALPPAAKLQSNVFGTHYELLLDPSVVPFEGPGATDAEGRPFGKCESLMDVQYKTRLKGFMRPRRCPTAEYYPAVPVPAPILPVGAQVLSTCSDGCRSRVSASVRQPAL